MVQEEVSKGRWLARLDDFGDSLVVISAVLRTLLSGLKMEGEQLKKKKKKIWSNLRELERSIRYERGKKKIW